MHHKKAWATVIAAAFSEIISGTSYSDRATQGSRRMSIDEAIEEGMEVVVVAKKKERHPNFVLRQRGSRCMGQMVWLC